MYEVPATIPLSIFAYKSAALCLSSPVTKVCVKFSGKGIKLYSNMSREREILKALEHLVRALSGVINENFGIEVSVTNTIPENLGLGDIPAILAAVCQAVSEKFDLNLNILNKIKFCLDAENSIKEYDPENFAAIFGGGLVLMRRYPPLLKKISVYEFDCVLVIPHVKYSAKKLAHFIPWSLKILDVSDLCVNSALFVLGLERGDLDLIKEIASKNVIDATVGKFIPYFVELKKKLGEMGYPAILCKLGPSFLVLGKGKMNNVAEFIEDFYKNKGYSATCIPTKLSNLGIKS